MEFANVFYSKNPLYNNNHKKKKEGTARFVKKNKKTKNICELSKQRVKAVKFRWSSHRMECGVTWCAGRHVKYCLSTSEILHVYLQNIACGAGKSHLSTCKPYTDRV